MSRIRMTCIATLLWSVALSAQAGATSTTLFERRGCDMKKAVTLGGPQIPTVVIPPLSSWKALCPSCKGPVEFGFLLAVDVRGTVCRISTDEHLGSRLRLAKAVAKELAAYTFPPAEENGKPVAATFHLTAVVDLP